MSEIWLLVLARDPSGAKTRLSGVLDPESRSRIAVAMLRDVLDASHGVPFARRVVVTESDALRRIARTMDTEAIDTPATGRTSPPVSPPAAAPQPAASALVLAADPPLLAATDLAAMRDAALDADVVIAPDRHRRGTNALLLTPPTAIAPAFGPDSFRLHRDRARDAALRTRIVATRGLATDVDDADDLRLVLRDPALRSHTAEVLGGLFLLA